MLMREPALLLLLLLASSLLQLFMVASNYYCSKKIRMHEVWMKRCHLSTKLLHALRVSSFSQICHIFPVISARSLGPPNGDQRRWSPLRLWRTAMPINQNFYTEFEESEFAEWDGFVEAVQCSWSPWHSDSVQWPISISSSCHLWYWCCSLISIFMLFIGAVCVLISIYEWQHRNDVVAIAFKSNTELQIANDGAHCVRILKSQLIFPFTLRKAQCEEKSEMKRCTRTQDFVRCSMERRSVSWHSAH